ncbi:hypothetical protein OU787_20700 [Kitasatospora sp. YST-16]|uniref:hypothetical protein n=1 Tax=Kitasatospora sp. YST-16 TaxID=2998080 RepID=UPI0022836A12|nr:hypothetical protein [Kitasatospora sp. YST-16]WAL73719.1 hypothetical protein OU787_20700 [Kitasatospora sp. YST-16]WNW39784.1 hypothetical protein RKE32_20660 [Streptomyces sp. Li-HN-5-13]
MQISFATAPGHPDRPNEDLVLAGPDTVLVLDGAGLPDGTATGCAHGVPWFVRTLGAELLHRTPDGYWVAGPDPAAARHALTGTAPWTALRGAALLTDGAARPVDDFATTDWPGLLTLLRDTGPQSLIDHTRALERTDPHHTRWPRTKTHDDATAALLRP